MTKRQQKGKYCLNNYQTFAFEDWPNHTNSSFSKMDQFMIRKACFAHASKLE